MSGMMAHGTALRRGERPPLPPRRHRRRNRHRRRRRRRRSQSWPRSIALPFERGRGARSCNARGRAKLFLTIYLKCTLFSHREGRYRRPPHRCTLHSEARGRRARRREEEKKHYTTRHCETGTTSTLRGPRSFASGLPTARFRRCAALPCVASRLRRRAATVAPLRRACAR